MIMLRKNPSLLASFIFFQLTHNQNILSTMINTLIKNKNINCKNKIF